MTHCRSTSSPSSPARPPCTPCGENTGARVSPPPPRLLQAGYAQSWGCLGAPRPDSPHGAGLVHTSPDTRRSLGASPATFFPQALRRRPLPPPIETTGQSLGDNLMFLRKEDFPR